jgi:competence protein ComEC
MKKLIWMRLLQIAALLILAVSSVALASENLTAHFIDVGQGDSILLQFNGKNVLIDGGTQEMGPRVETYLRNHGVSSLDLLKGRKVQLSCVTDPIRKIESVT